MLAQTYSMDIRPSDDGLVFYRDKYDVLLVLTEKVSSGREPEGLLEIRMDDGHNDDGIQRRFADTRHRPLEEQVSLVVKSLVCSAKATHKRTLVNSTPDRLPAVMSIGADTGDVLEQAARSLSAVLIDLEKAVRRCRWELLRESELRRKPTQDRRRVSNAR
jgi:hypothetical protein